jgi:hypothetical protein
MCTRHAAGEAKRSPMPYNPRSGPAGRFRPMKLATSLALLAGALALWANACDYPTFHFRAGAGAGTTTSSGGGPGGTGGSGASPGGSGGSGGVGPECTLLGQQDTCGAGRKCTVIDAILGTLGCVTAGTAPDFQACTSNEECGVFSWCDQPTGVCRPICLDSTTCTNVFGLGAGSTCAPTQQDGAAVMGGLKGCTAHCNPQDSQPCVGGAVPVTCAWRSSPGDWDCMVSGGGGDGDGCTEGWDCQPGLACGAYDHTCQPWCDAPDGCCTTCVACVCGACEAFGVALVYDGLPLGACYSTLQGEHTHICC